MYVLTLKMTCKKCRKSSIISCKTDKKNTVTFKTKTGKNVSFKKGKRKQVKKGENGENYKDTKYIIKC